MDYNVGFLVEDNRYKLYFINLSIEVVEVHLESMDMYGEHDDKPIQSTIAGQDLKKIMPSSSALIEEGDIANLDPITIFSINIDNGKKVKRYNFTLPSYIRATREHTDNIPILNKKGLILELNK